MAVQLVTKQLGAPLACDKALSAVSLYATAGMRLAEQKAGAASVGALYAHLRDAIRGSLGALGYTVAADAVRAKTLTGAFFHAGTYSSFRGRVHGRPLDPGAAGHRFVGYTQTHDQVGNRALGDRLTADQLTLGAALVLTSPFTPMLFMGEEWGAGTPWQFFTDHTDPELADAVRRGRRREFAAHGWAEADIPDPQDPATRARSCLDWSEPEREPHARLLEWYRTLIALRASEPELTDPDRSATEAVFDEDARWLLLRRGSLYTAVNFATEPRALPLDGYEVVASSIELPQIAGTFTIPGRAAAVLRRVR